MKALELPEELKGRWENALILTYSLDIPFFESALLSQFGTTCRNKIILADGEKYLEACANYAESGLVRHMNQRYLAEGIFSPRAAHAKLIMLTNAEQGRLLVGSGNLGLQGYASPGEMFTRYEYSIEQQATLPAFRSAVELVEGLSNHDFVSNAATSYFRRMLSATPWLYKAAEGDWKPVRHNLSRSFIDQLVEEVGGESVEELWVLSPFYDEEAVALQELLERLRPLQSTLLVQDGCTSVKSEALKRVINGWRSKCSVRAFTGKEHDTEYFHAKLYLLKLAERAICLQGSPNLSQVAMRWYLPRGNVELANLLTGSRNAFDYLLDDLQIEPEASSFDALNLSFQTTQEKREEPAPGWRLISGEWQSIELTLRFMGDVPPLSDAFLNIDGHLFSFELVRSTEQQLVVRVYDEATVLLQTSVALRVQWGEEESAVASNPIFVCNRDGLNAYIESSEETDSKIGGVGGLSLEDEELEQLVGELQSHMVVDRGSVWQLANRRPTAPGDDEDDALRLDYADIDYDMLRRHPKLRQYRAARQHGTIQSRSRLQIILSSITDHFNGLVDYASGARPAVTKSLEETDAQSEEEREEEEAESQSKSRTREQRLRSIFKHFIRRYLRGLRSPDFQELVGYQVMTDNYIIFAHLLWALSRKEWFNGEIAFLTESSLRTFRFFWGSDGDEGYYGRLDGKEQPEVLAWVQEHHADAQVLATLFHLARLTKSKGIYQLRFQLRDFWRYLLRAEPFPMGAKVIEGTWNYVWELAPHNPPRPTNVLDELTKLAHFEIGNHFLRTVEENQAYRAQSCQFDRVDVFREKLEAKASVKCLVVRDESGLQTLAEAQQVLKSWMQFERMIVADTHGEPPDYYRIVSPHLSDSRRLLLYEVTDGEGLYLNRDSEEGVVEFGRVESYLATWDTGLREAVKTAAIVDQDLTLQHPRYAHISQSVA